MPRTLRAAAVVALLVVPTASIPVPAHAADDCPRVVVHRANPLVAPENTLPGIASVPGTGSGVVEVDVQWSSSHFPILMHDSTVDRTTNGTGPASSLGLGQLTGLRAQDYAPWRTDPRFADTRVPYGYDFMAAVKAAGLDLLLDVSATPTQQGMEKLRIYVQDYHGWGDRTLVMGGADKVRAMRAWQPGLRYAVIEYPGAEVLRRGESLLQLGAEAYVIPSRDVTPAAVDYYHAYGLPVWTWTSDTTAIDQPATWQAMAAAGVDYLITNRPGEAITALDCTG
jgi:glycerophosphoryl diester phosphodiesterase